MLLSIVTINYKTPDTTLACVSSVYKQYKKEFENGEIEHIIVDNNSGDDSIKQLNDAIKKAKYKQVHVLANQENVGFGNGSNFGVEKAQGTYILFLNSDTLVEDRGLLKMVTFLQEHRHAAIVGGQLTHTDRSMQLSAWKFYTLGNLLLVLLGGERWGMIKNSTKEIGKVDWVSGGCLMIKKSTFEQLGKFDKHIFMYMEDMELCYRAKKEGLDTYLYPHISIIHASQGSSSRSFAIVNIYKGIRYFYAKHMPRWQYPIADFLLKCKSIILVIIGKVTGNSYLTKTYEETLRFS